MCTHSNLLTYTYTWPVGSQCRWAVLLGSLQGHIPHAVHRIWPIPATEHHRGVGDNYQHAHRGFPLCHVHWTHLDSHPFCWLSQQEIQGKGTEFSSHHMCPKICFACMTKSHHGHWFFCTRWCRSFLVMWYLTSPAAGAGGGVCSLPETAAGSEAESLWVLLPEIPRPHVQRTGHPQRTVSPSHGGRSLRVKTLPLHCPLD